MCRKYGDTSTWGYTHNFGQESASGNWEYQQHNQYFSGHHQQNIGYQTFYGNQQISSHHQAVGDYTWSGHQPYIGHGHQQYTGHGDYNMGHREEDMRIQGDSGYHGEEDNEKEEGEFSD